MNRGMTVRVGRDRSQSAQQLARISGDAASGWRTQTLENHLTGTAGRAATFAAAFGSAEWGYLAGLLHDVGKCHPRFQDYLRASSGYEPSAGSPAKDFDHAIAGADLAIRRFGDVIGRVLAYPIAGHHAGLADWESADGGGQLATRLRDRVANLDATLATGALPAAVLDTPVPSTRPPVGTEEAIHLWIRMLFSCVVDADSLDAEAFDQPLKAAARADWAPLEDMRLRLGDKLAGLPAHGEMNRLRTEVREQALRHAADVPGFFSLTVPTGGGKTLTSLAFALEHARIHGHRRVVYAIPYLSIIEQTAKVFRDAVGADVLEHHSSVDVDDEQWRAALAAENWDAPLIVTTAVQLFESLFASKRGRCRKLHNLAGAVLILDEAQLLPPEFLEPILSVLRVLVQGYGVSVVLCTATQPSLGDRRRPDGTMFKGLGGIRELVEDPAGLGRRLERVRVEWPEPGAPATEWTEVAAELAAERQVLCIVNTRSDARTLSALVPGAVALTALMCAEHRSAVLTDITEKLRTGAEVRVVSTQLVEAGVDIDFPVVWRALAGLDSIAQAAGRCNREGRLPAGRVRVFVPPTRSPGGHLRQGEQATRSLLAESAGAGLLTPGGYERYFDLLYGVKGSLDARGILPLLTRDARSMRFAFRQAASAFRLIEDDGPTAFVPYGRGADLVEELRASIAKGRQDRRLFRRLQRFTVALRRHELAELDRCGGIQRLTDDLVIVHPDFYGDNGVSVLGRDFSIGLIG